MESKITIIGFDGINRSGKGTQIELLTKHISNNIENAISVVIRGEGSRSGIGSTIDPAKNTIQFNSKSSYRENQFTQLKEKFNNGINDYQGRTSASNRLNRELYVLCNKILPNLGNRYGKDLYVLVDRTIISRRFYELQQTHPLGYEKLLTFKQLGGYTQNVVIPQVIFTFSLPKDKLLKRFSDSELKEPQGKFRKKIIESTYEKFGIAVKDGMQIKDLNNRIVELDGDKDKNDIHNEIITTLRSRSYLI